MGSESKSDLVQRVDEEMAGVVGGLECAGFYGGRSLFEVPWGEPIELHRLLGQCGLRGGAHVGAACGESWCWPFLVPLLVGSVTGRIT